MLMRTLTSGSRQWLMKSSARVLCRAPAGMARLQLRRLQRLGWRLPTIADQIGVTTVELDELVGGAETCTARLTVRVTALARAELVATEALRPAHLSDVA